MENFYNSKLSLIIFAFFLVCLVSTSGSFAQQKSITDFVIFSGNPLHSNSTDQDLNSSVYIGSGSQIKSGEIGSYNLVKTTGKTILNANVLSGENAEFANDNTINGNILISNLRNTTYKNLMIGSNALIRGNIFVNGSIYIKSGKITGIVKHPYGTNYYGPAPDGGEIIQKPELPNLPLMPSITEFDQAGESSIYSSKTISEGSYKDLLLPGYKTLVFSGPGTYIFKSIKNTGINNFVFDFKNKPGNIKIYIFDNASVGKIKTKIINGGDAGRIYTEVHGNGTSSSNQCAFNLDNGLSATYPSNWMGTIWAPYGKINIGSGSGSSYIQGALYSGSDVTIRCNVILKHVPYIFCQEPKVNAGPDKELSCDVTTIQLNGKCSNQNVTFNWEAIDGGVIINGKNTLNPTVSAGGNYILTATDKYGGCSSSDTIHVNFKPCIFPYYPPPPNGKIVNQIGAELNSLYLNFGNVTDSGENIFQIKGDSVLIEVIALQGKYPQLLALLQQPVYGISNLIDNGPQTLIITGLYPIANLGKLDSLPQLIDYCRPLFPPQSNSGITTSQGDLSIHSDLIRNGYDVKGSGIKVGVISDSYNTIPGNPANVDVLNGDLPGPGNSENIIPVQIIKDYPFGRRTDEGRAMLQIVHDIAPKAELAFRTGFISAGDFAQGILQLQQANCDVIVDDVTFITEPFFQDGIVAKAVDLVTSAGVSYFSAAGNYGNKSYENQFNPIAPPSNITGFAHNFGGGDRFQNLSLTPGTYTIVLQWQDEIYSMGQSQSGTINDLDIYLTDNNGATLFGFNRNNIGGDPLEIMPFTVTANTTTNILIVNASGNANVRFKYVVFRGELTFNEFNTGTSTIVGQANSAGAMTVGAVLFSNTPAFGVNPPTIASFSSSGGTQINSSVRNKPDFAAPNGINTTVNLGGSNIDGDAFPNFFGTSAAAPHAAAVAALLLDASNKYTNNVLSPQQMRILLQNTSINIGSSGFDFSSGYGLIQADSAIKTFAAPTPGLISLELPQGEFEPGSIPFQLNVIGEFFNSQSVVLFRGNPLATTVLSSTVAVATIPAFMGNPPIQVFTPPVSEKGTDGGYSDTLFFFSPIKKTITVKADNKIKRYGEQLPQFTGTILVDSIPFEDSGLTLLEIGLDTILFSSSANNYSNTGNYFIRPAMRVLNNTDSLDIGLEELYNYTFTDGLLSIQKMPLEITAKDTSLTYGDKIDHLDFKYVYPEENILLSERIDFLNLIKSEHAGNIAADVFALVDSRAIVNGRSLTNEDLINMSALASARSIVNARAIINSRAIINGVGNDTTHVVDVAVESIFNYQLDSASAILVSARPIVNSRAIINARAIINGTAIVNSRAIINGGSIVNANTFNNESNKNVVVIIDATDVSAPETDTTLNLKPINMITGITSGQHAIIPAALISDNFSITYGLGNLQIKPANLNVSVRDTSIKYGQLISNFESVISGFQYDDDKSSVIESLAKYKLQDTSTNQFFDLDKKIPTGIYRIIPYNLSLFMPSSYTVTYINGLLRINKTTLKITARDTSRIYGDKNPIFSLEFDGFENNDGPEDLILPEITTSANKLSKTGSYPLVLNGGSSDNYLLEKTDGTLTINAAPLIVKADDKVINASDHLCKFTSTYTGFKNQDSTLIISEPKYKISPEYKGLAGTYTITPYSLILPVPENYDINYLIGTLYVNPAKHGAKKILTYLSCVDTLLNDPEGFKYVAHFEYNNRNKSSVYIPVGEDNRIITEGNYLGKPTEIFLPGTGSFEIYFNGDKLVWEIRTYESNKKTAVASSASSNSSRCKTIYAAIQNNKLMTSELDHTNISKIAKITPDKIEDKIIVYPNPVNDILKIKINSSEIKSSDIILYDTNGRIQNLNSLEKTSDLQYKLDISNVYPGVYILKIKVENSYKTFRIIKL